MCTRSTKLRRLRQQQQQQVPPNLVETPKDTMADNRTMAELLQAPTEGYEDAIVVPEIEAANFGIKHRYPNVPTTSIKLMLFPFSLEGAARIWLEKEPPRSIQTWDDLVAKFINQFFPPSKTTNLRNEITNFKQRFDESFSEAWDRFKDLLRACPHHGFSELHQLDTFYNALNVNDQDSLNSAAGGNFLDKRPADCSSIIESKSKVRNSKAKPLFTRALLLDKQTSPVPAPAHRKKALRQSWCYLRWHIPEIVMMAIFHDMIEKMMEVFMDDFSVFGSSFSTCLTHLEKMLKRCEDTNLALNWRKAISWLRNGMSLTCKISKSGIEGPDRARLTFSSKAHHTDYCKRCIEAINTLKKNLTEAPILIAPDWNEPFELMCDASDFALGAVLGQRHEKHFRPIHYASKTMNEAESRYTTTEKEMLAVVYAFKKFRSYLVMNKCTVYTDHFRPSKYLYAKKDSKARVAPMVLLLQDV
ncbi:reverse transcriptase domain-containing protein [Tanacetum coccineum]|uniref:Reverse transcriptase domain-containing protein n=1 Tax=Tanacetum coccineum TaxID=301880 RepID=A0ABQ5F137_9ASTR